MIPHFTTPFAYLRDDGSVDLIGTFPPLLAHRLRSAIPASALRHDRRRRRWRIAPGHSEIALQAFRAVFPDASILTRRGVA